MGEETAGLLSSGASAAIGAAPQSAPQIDPRQVITQLLQRMQQPQGNGGQPLTSFGPSIAPPQTPPQSGGNAPGVFQNRPGGYNSRGEAQRDKNSTIFQNMGNLVSSFAKAEEAKKQRHVETISGRLFSAMQGLNEAKAAGNQEAIQQNAQIINDLMGDPKTRKMLEKAFDINLFGESKHKDSPEQKGLMSAFSKMQQDYQSGKSELNPYAQKFMSQQPVRQSLSPEEQAKEHAINAGSIPSANAQLQATTHLTEALTKSTDAAERNQTLKSIADQRVAAQSKSDQTKIDVEFMRATAQMSVQDREDARARYTMSVRAGMQDKALAFAGQKLDKGIALSERLAGIKADLEQQKIDVSKENADTNKSKVDVSKANLLLKGQLGSNAELAKQATTLKTQLDNLTKQKKDIDDNMTKLQNKGVVSKWWNSDEIKNLNVQSAVLSAQISGKNADIDALTKKLDAAAAVTNSIVKGSLGNNGEEGLSPEELGQ